MSEPREFASRQELNRFGPSQPGWQQLPVSTSFRPALRPTPPRRFRWLVLALAALFLLLVGGVATGLTMRELSRPQAAPPSTIQLAVTSAALGWRAKLQSSDLRTVTVLRRSAPTDALTLAAARSLVGLTVVEPIAAGTFLSRSMVAPIGAVPSSTEAIVGLNLKPGQLPADGLRVGERVLVLLLPGAEGGTRRAVPLVNTMVWAVNQPDATGDQRVSIAVPTALVPQLSSYANTQQVSLALTPALAKPLRQNPIKKFAKKAASKSKSKPKAESKTKSKRPAARQHRKAKKN